jgi:hypothetical protein
MGGVSHLKKTVRRRSLATILARMATAQAVVIGGPRSVGKSTLLAALAKELGRPVVDLDDPGTRRAVTSDPMRFLDAGRPVLVDEYAREDSSCSPAPRATGPCRRLPRL